MGRRLVLIDDPSDDMGLRIKIDKIGLTWTISSIIARYLLSYSYVSGSLRQCNGTVCIHMKYGVMYRVITNPKFYLSILIFMIYTYPIFHMNNVFDI